MNLLGINTVRKTLIAAALALLVCCTHLKELPRDGWHHPSPVGLIPSLNRIASVDVLPVDEMRLATALERLNEPQIIQVSVEEAEDLTRKNLDGDTFLLSRGLCVGCKTGSFAVYTDGEVMVVDHVSLAARNARPTRWPIIVRSVHIPNTLYVQCHAVR